MSQSKADDQMGIWQSIKSLFAAPSLTNPTEGWKLDGSSQSSLAQSLSRLPQGNTGWITFSEAQALFSAMEPQYAFGETDKDGNQNLTAFAAKHQVDFSFIPAEGRVYLSNKRH